MGHINKRDKKHNYPKRLKTFPEDFSIASSSSAPGVTREELAENGFIYIDKTSIECEYCKLKIILSKIKDPVKEHLKKRHDCIASIFENQKSKFDGRMANLQLRGRSIQENVKKRVIRDQSPGDPFKAITESGFY